MADETMAKNRENKGLYKPNKEILAQICYCNTRNRSGNHTGS